MIDTALVIGVDDVDRAAYPAPYDAALPPLGYAENSARALGAIAARYGATSVTSLLGGGAATTAIGAAIDALARATAPGATVLLSFSGHGVQLPDPSGLERDGYSECWCAWDAPLRDAAILARLTAFPRGSTVVLVSDCCFSGGIFDAHDGPSVAGIAANVVAFGATGEHAPAFRAEHGDVSAFVAALDEALRARPADYTELARDLTGRLTSDELAQTPSVKTLRLAPCEPPFWATRAV